MLITNKGMIAWLRNPRVKDYGYKPENMTGRHYRDVFKEIHLAEFETNFEIAVTGQAVGYVCGACSVAPEMDVSLIPVEGGVLVVSQPRITTTIPEYISA